MKRLLLLSALFGCTFLATAQRSSFGLKAGVNFYTLTSGDYGSELSGKTGFHAGAFYRFPLAKLLYLQPEAVYSAEGAKLKDEEAMTKLLLNYLNIPMMLQVQTPSGFSIETGPQVGFLLSGKLKGTEAGVSVEEDIKDETNTVGFSWGVGVGYMFGNVGLSGRYNLGLSRLPKNADDGNDKSSGFQVNLVWRLNK